MSALIDMYTYEVMGGAIVTAVSSEVAAHPAEHAISPLEPNFAWEANEALAQHILTIDLGEVRTCDGYSFIHQENEISGPAESTRISCEYSTDSTIWEDAVIVYNSDGTNNPDDLYDEDIRVKLRHFSDGSNNIMSLSARYWRFTVYGVLPSNYYAESDARISMCWLFRINQLDRGAAFPTNDKPVYPSGSVELPFGKEYRTGYNVNPHVLFSRTWMVTEAEYDILRAVMRECNGTAKPFLFVENSGARRLCRFTSDIIGEEIVDVGLWRVTIDLVELPITGKDEYH